MGVKPNAKERRNESVSKSQSASGSNEDNIQISFRFRNNNLLSYDQSITIVDNNK